MVLGIKEGLVECGTTVCVKSVVILLYIRVAKVVTVHNLLTQ